MVMKDRPQWKPSKPPPRDRKLYDAYFDWTLKTEFAYYGKPHWVPVLIEIENVEADKFAETAASWGEWIRIPQIYRVPSRRFKKQKPKFITALVKRDRLVDLLQGGPSVNIRRAEIGRMVDTPKDHRLTGRGWGDLARDKRMAAPFPENTVIIGVIDDSIAFAHDRFRDQTSTRIYHFWDQQIPSDDSGRWDYGREIRKLTPVEGIDDRLQECLHGSLVDEDELYRKTEHLNFARDEHKPLALRGSHGTHVADLACNPPVGEGPIVAVQLPIATTADTSGATLKPQAYDGLVYMLDCAAKMGGKEPLPLVVNLSYGMYAGPHDGTGMLERAIDDLVGACNAGGGKPMLRVVLPAGNSHLLRCHANFILEGTKDENTPPDEAEKEESMVRMHWRVLPDDHTESFLEIWFPEKNEDDLLVGVVTPTGDATGFFGKTESREWRAPTGELVGQVDFYPSGVDSKRAVIRICLAPTAREGGGPTALPSGVWQVCLKNKSAKRIEGIDAWVQRDDTVHGYRRGARQSYLDDRKYARFDQGGRPIDRDSHDDTRRSYVKREGSFNAISGGKESIVASGLIRQSWKPALYSASGPLYPPGRGAPNALGPEVMAGSDDSASQRGILAAGSRSGSCVSMRGTSVAAPQIARLVADNIARNGQGDRQAAADFPKANVNPPDYTEKVPPAGAEMPKPGPKRGGLGRVDYQPMDRKPRFER